MQTIAVGDDNAAPFVDDKSELYMVDDCTTYVLTNVVGPVNVDSDELQLPEYILHACYQPDERLPQELSDRLMNLFTSNLYS